MDRSVGHRSIRRTKNEPSLTNLACSQTQRQGFQLLQQLPQRVQGRRVGELTLGIKLRLGIGDVHVRHVHRRHVQRNADVSKMKLSAGRAERAD